MKTIKRLTATAIILLAASGASWGSNMVVCDGNLYPSNCNVAPYKDPSPITSTNFNVYVQGGIDANLPFWLLVASPDAPSPIPAPLTPAFSSLEPLKYTVTAPSGPLAGSFTSGELYTFAGVSGASSMNFANMSSGCPGGTGTCPLGVGNDIEPGLLGATPTSFTVWKFEIDFATGVTIQPGDPFKFQLSSISAGSYIAGYGTDSQRNAMSTPFTTAGWLNGGCDAAGNCNFNEQSLPEPGVLSLFCLGLLGLGFRKGIRKS